jgi:hypothetical protein
VTGQLYRLSAVAQLAKAPEQLLPLLYDALRKLGLRVSKPVAREEMVKGVSAFADEVRARRYPEEEHGYTMAPDEIARLHDLLREQSGEPFTGGFSL